MFLLLPNSPPSGFDCGQLCSWTLTTAKKICRFLSQSLLTSTGSKQARDNVKTFLFLSCAVNVFRNGATQTVTMSKIYKSPCHVYSEFNKKLTCSSGPLFSLF